MRRRRFLTLLAACAAMPAGATPLRWHGTALGAEASLELHGPEAQTRRALGAALRAIRRVEALFSLFDPASALSRLNAAGRLEAPAADMRALFAAADAAWRATGGRFDPSVQAVWPRRADARVGWDRVRADGAAIHLAPGQQLTFNGIAQGYATDLAAAALRAAGLRDIHVNVGEQVADGPARRLGLIDPVAGQVGTVTLENAAIATSSPAATPVGPAGHIISPLGEPVRWSTVSVLARTATQADGLSTGLCHAPMEVVRQVRRQPGIAAIVLVDAAGDVIRI
ncbi:MAG: FAD:protein FMN transferase [Pseudomonadota bacterium]